MSPDPEETEAFSPGERITLVAEAILVRAELADLRDEAQANFDRLAKMWQPTSDDIDTADELNAIAIDSYTTARHQNAEELAILDDALRLTDHAIEHLESPDSRLTLTLAYALEQLQYRLEELTDSTDLRDPLDVLRAILEDH